MPGPLERKRLLQQHFNPDLPHVCAAFLAREKPVVEQTFGSIEITRFSAVESQFVYEIRWHLSQIGIAFERLNALFCAPLQNTKPLLHPPFTFAIFRPPPNPPFTRTNP